VFVYISFMKGSKGIAPIVAVIAILAAAGVGTPTAMAEMQHREMITLTPDNPAYGIMKAGEGVMNMYQFNKTEWYGRMEQTRSREMNQLQQNCPECSEQIQQLEQERTRLRQQQQEAMEQEQVRTETQAREGEGSGVQTETQTQAEGNQEQAPGTGTANQQGK
jgi:TolA-binding protein